MAKRNMTPEERKAFGQKMKEAREIKKSQAPNTETVQLTKEQFDKLMKLAESAEQPAPASYSPTDPRLGAQGQNLGVTEKFTTDPAHYEDPIETLYDMPEFARYALRENYRLKWNVSPTKYQTVFGTWYIEPRFELVIARRRLNPDGTPRMTKDENGKDQEEVIILGRGSFFQDPAADLLEADMAGVNYKQMSPEDFSSTMRLWRYFRFINDVLNPPSRAARPKGMRQEVIAGKAYEIENFQQLV